MKKLTFRWSDHVPEDHMNKQFVQGMLDRLIIGFHKYGHNRRKHDRPDNIKNVRIRLKEYKRTGNTEFLMDAANFCLMEFSVPAHPKAHYRPTDSNESPGSAVAGRMIHSKTELKPATGLHAPRVQREGD